MLRNNRHAFLTTGSFSTGDSLYSNYYRAGNKIRNRYGAFSQKSSLPNGYLAPYSISLPQKPGNMSSTTLSNGDISNNSSYIYAGRNLEGSSNCTIILTNAQLDQIVSLVASASLVISKNNAALAGAANAVAAASLTLTLSDAQLGAIVSSIASAAISINPSVTLSALGFMEAEGGGFPELSAQGLAQAMWEYDISSINTDNSSGKKLNDLSSGGASLEDIENAIWDALQSDHVTEGSMGDKINKLLTVAKFLGLK